MSGNAHAVAEFALVIAFASFVASAIAGTRARYRVRSGKTVYGVIEAAEREFGAYVQPLTARYNGLVSYSVVLEGLDNRRTLIKSYVPHGIGDRIAVLYEPSKDRFAFRFDVFIPGLIFLLGTLTLAICGLLLFIGPFE